MCDGVKDETSAVAQRRRRWSAGLGEVDLTLLATAAALPISSS